MVIWTKRPLPQVELRRSELVFVGYGIVAPEYAWNDYAGTDVHGKTVVVLVNDPAIGSKDPKVFKGGAMTYYGRWDYKIEEAARQGAAGVLLVHDGAAPATAGTWSRALGPARNWNSRPRMAMPHPPAVEGWLQKDAAVRRSRRRGSISNAATAAAAHPGFKPISMGLHADATLQNSVRPFTSANVIACCRAATATMNMSCTRPTRTLWAATLRAPAIIFSMGRSTMPRERWCR